MFVDNPVGTGYSYVEDPSQLTTDNAMIAADLVTLVKTVFSAYPDMQVMPFYVFAESYGGKMTVDFALAFDQVGNSTNTVISGRRSSSTNTLKAMINYKYMKIKLFQGARQLTPAPCFRLSRTERW